MTRFEVLAHLDLMSIISGGRGRRSIKEHSINCSGHL